MACSIRMLFLILIEISNSISNNILFEDDFKVASLNETKWEVISSDEQCKKLFPKQLSCATNRIENLKTISGALVLTAIHEPYADHSFTSATVITRESFNLSSSNLMFEVRAAVPIAGGLYGQVVLIPEEDMKNNTINGTIFIMMNFRNLIKSGYTYDLDKFYVNSFDNDVNLEQFQTYRFLSNPGQIQFTNDTTFQWSMNDQRYSPVNSLDVNCNRSSCLKILNKSQFRLALSLAVDDILDGRNKAKIIGNWWKCSSMLIDYVRVISYDQSENLTKIAVNQTEKLASEICPINEQNWWKGWKFYCILVTSILVIFCLALIYFIRKLRKIKIKLQRARQNENCYEMIELPDILSSMRENSTYSNDYQGVNQYEYISYTYSSNINDDDSLIETEV